MEIPRHWRNKHQTMRLEGVVCENNHKMFPPRKICPECADKNTDKPVEVIFSSRSPSYTSNSCTEVLQTK